MDNVSKVGQIVSDCLGAVDFVLFLHPFSVGMDGDPCAGSDEKHGFFIQLLEYAGGTVKGELGRDLTPEEVMLVYDRVKLFVDGKDSK